MRASLRTKRTSTSHQRGASRGLPGSWYLLCGVAYAFQEVEPAHPALQAQVWDVRLDAVLTEREIILCTQAPACTTG